MFRYGLSPTAARQHAPTTAPKPASFLATAAWIIFGRTGRWDVIREAIKDGKATINLCAIIAVSTIPPAAITLVALWLARH